MFSIVDFNTPDEADGTEDPAMYDEEDSVDDLPEQSQSGGANTKGAVNQGRTSGGNVRVAPEDDIAPADRDELRSEEDAQEANFPARVQVQVTRGSRGALTLDCVVQDGEMTIDNVYYFPKAEMADAKTAETDYSRRSLYTGPPFGQLDEELQVLLERYLEERGIDTTMALFIPDYIDMKEQKEYIRWLDSKFCWLLHAHQSANSISRHEELCRIGGDKNDCSIASTLLKEGQRLSKGDLVCRQNIYCNTIPARPNLPLKSVKKKQCFT